MLISIINRIFEVMVNTMVQRRRGEYLPNCVVILHKDFINFRESAGFAEKLEKLVEKNKCKTEPDRKCRRR